MTLPESTPASASADPVFNYHLLRNALDQCKCNPSALDEAQYRQVRSRAERSYALESRVLAAPEAEGVIIPETELDGAVTAVAERYADDQEFIDDLGANGLDRDSLRSALRRELLFDAVMQRVAADAAAVEEVDMRLFYELHGDRFTQPELRSARHLLITINPDYAENTREAATQRIEALAQRINGKPRRFTDLARRHSECPSAMEGGSLGEVHRGALYPELDRVLFAMQEGEISGPVESEVGLHLLLCEKIKPGRRLSFSSVRDKIAALLKQRRMRHCQQHFLAALGQDPKAQTDHDPADEGR